MNGVVLGAAFSWGCPRAVDLGISDKLKEYAESQGKSYSEKEIRKELKKLASHLFYRVIALANGLDDPFRLEVVRAHWIGNALLDRVSSEHAVAVIKEEAGEGDPFSLAYILGPVLKEKGAHHNTYIGYVVHSRACRVELKEDYFWHLGSKRWPATPRDIFNFKKYGRV